MLNLKDFKVVIYNVQIINSEKTGKKFIKCLGFYPCTVDGVLINQPILVFEEKTPDFDDLIASYKDSPDKLLEVVLNGTSVRTKDYSLQIKPCSISVEL